MWLDTIVPALITHDDFEQARVLGTSGPGAGGGPSTGHGVLVALTEAEVCGYGCSY